jgi:cytidylate kinase
MSIVGISETMGSLGDDIGRELGRRHGWEFADREIISKAAERFGESPIDLMHVTEEKPSLLERIRDTYRQYVVSVEAILLEMAARDNVILSGRGATVVLAKVPHVLRVRITAPETVRAERIRQRMGLTPEASLDQVRQADRERAARIRFLYHVDWDDPLLYDVVLNTERLTVERATRMLDEMLQDPRWAGTPESRRRLADLSIAAQATAGLLVSPATRTLKVLVSCTDGQVSVSGMVDGEEQRKAVDDLVSAISGVKGVLNEVTVRRVRIPGPLI